MLAGFASLLAAKAWGISEGSPSPLAASDGGRVVCCVFPSEYIRACMQVPLADGAIAKVGLGTISFQRIEEWSGTWVGSSMDLQIPSYISQNGEQRDRSIFLVEFLKKPLVFVLDTTGLPG